MQIRIIQTTTTSNWRARYGLSTLKLLSLAMEFGYGVLDLGLGFHLFVSFLCFEFVFSYYIPKIEALLMTIRFPMSIYLYFLVFSAICWLVD